MKADPGPAEIDARFAAVSASRTFRNVCAAYGLGAKAVLDIGCSYGEHLAHFGPGSKGLTINPIEAEEARRRGLSVDVGNIEEGYAGGAAYDAIYCSNLFEHLYAPHRFLYSVRELLVPGGILILGVPVLPFPRALLHLRKFRGALADAHINFFTGTTLRYTVERAGWRLRAMRGFHISNAALDSLFYPVYPHLYVIAEPDPSFRYSEKREKELAGYHK